MDDNRCFFPRFYTSKEEDDNKKPFQPNKMELEDISQRGPPPEENGSLVESSPSSDRVKRRSLKVKTGLVNGCNGSSYVEYGKTKVICSVQGPRAIYRTGQYKDSCQVECEFKYSPWSEKNLTSDSPFQQSNVMSQAERYQSTLIVSAIESSIQLEKYPKSIISLNIVVLNDAGSELPASIIAASLALIGYFILNSESSIIYNLL
jgi:ribonuclease PH